MPARLPKYRQERNAKRVDQAEVALLAFAEATGLSEADHDVWVSDLLCNLMHYCEQQGKDLETELAHGQMHYEAEIDPKDDIG